jgi:hypothetical protein
VTYIRCPQCGARALSVATACPQCHHVLTQNPMQLGPSSELMVCRVCKKYTPRTSATCQFCGAPTHGVRLSAVVKVVLWLVVGGGVAVGLVMLLRTPQPAPAPATPAAGQRQVVPPEAVAPAETLPVPVAAAITAEPPPQVATVTRWTAQWLNLRDGPGHDTNVIRPVPPGTRLEVANPVGAWWRVYEAGIAVGFISGTELLRSPPPDTTP